MAKSKKYTPGLEDCERTIEIIKKRRWRKQHEDYKLEQEKKKSTSSLGDETSKQ